MCGRWRYDNFIVMSPALWDDQKYNLCRIYAGNNVCSKSIVLHLIGHVWTLDLSDIGHGLLAVSSSQDIEPWDFSVPGLVTLDTLARIGDITDDTSHKGQGWRNLCLHNIDILFIYQECGKCVGSAVKNYLTIASLDHLSLFIRRNSKQCDISVGSDRLITDTFLRAEQIFFGIGLGCFYPALSVTGWGYTWR